MYARVTTVQYQPGKADEATQIFRESIVPAAKQQPGFKDIIGLIDRSTGKGMAIALWETEADMKAGATSGFLQTQLNKIASLLAAAPVIETYEVIAQE